MTLFDLGETDRLLTTTRAVRRRLDLARPVEPEVIDECLRIALQAPSASNEQRWRFVVVRDAATRAEIGALYRKTGAEYLARSAGKLAEQGDDERAKVYDSAAFLAEHLGEVPAHVIAYVEGSLPDSGLADGASLAVVTSLFASIYPALWSFQLALRSRGLGSVLTTLPAIFADRIGELVDAPDGHLFAALVPVAYTLGDDFRPARRRSQDEVVFWERWGKPR